MTDQTTQAGPRAEGSATTDAHRRLEPFAGTFNAEVTMWMGPGEPSRSSGVMTNSLELGGRYLHQRYKGEPGDGAFPGFEGHGYWGYNTVRRAYEGFWIDSASTFMQTETGDVDASGKVWTMVGEMTNPQTGQPMRKKSVITLRDRDHHTVEMYFGTPGGAETKAMEIKYARTR